MEKKDLVIIGSGPAGLSAAVYAQRAMLEQVVIEKESYSGGQIVVTDKVDNYLGLPGEGGYELSVRFREHADKLKVPFLEGEVVKIKDQKDFKEVHMENGDIIKTEAVIIAAGASHKKLGVPGETELTGAGVSYCATCDGAFFKEKTVAVIGGGDVALSDAIYLSEICKKVYLIHRREELRGAKNLQDKIFEKENIEFLPYCEVKEICGKNKVENIVISDNRTNEQRKLEVSGVFVAIGMKPQSEFVKDIVDIDNSGYIKAGEDCRTNVDKIYAIGDIRTKPLRQIVTAVSDGAVAVSSFEYDNMNI